MSATLLSAIAQPIQNGRQQLRTDLKVLCIDDDPNVVRSISRELSRQQIEPLQALHGMQGYWLACIEQPDVIILDLAMPRGNGAYVLECLRRNIATRTIPVIILSRSDDLRLWHQVGQSIVDVVLHKPVPFRRLLRAIEELT
jgi:DNA-binding response OmpR family regulator